MCFWTFKAPFLFSFLSFSKSPQIRQLCPAPELVSDYETKEKKGGRGRESEKPRKSGGLGIFCAALEFGWGVQRARTQICVLPKKKKKRSWKTEKEKKIDARNEKMKKKKIREGLFSD